jgi:two-component system, NarL family, nitrate/nitrite response regulator NarL
MSALVLAVGARIYRDGVAAALSQQPDVTVTAVEADVAAVMTCLERRWPDALLIDVALAGGLELARFAATRTPPVKVIALAVRADDDDRQLLQWAEAGAAGFVTSSNSLAELHACVQSVLRGELACSPRLSAKLLRRVAELAGQRAPAKDARAPVLTPRQARVLHLVRQGQSNKQIARELDIEIATVKNHVHQLLQRLHVHHRSEAAASVAPDSRSLPGRA